MKLKLSLFSIALLAILPLQPCVAKDEAKGKTVPATEVKKDTVEGLMDELLANFTKLPDILGLVKDEASATIAADEIDTMSTDIAKIAKRLAPLAVPSDEEKLRIDKKMVEGTTAMKEKLMGSMMQMAQSPEAAAIVSAAIQKFSKNMQAHEATFSKFGKDYAKKKAAEAGE